LKSLRIGVILLLIGVTLLFATNARSTTIYASDSRSGHPGPMGPYLLEPREITIALRDVSPESETFTFSVVDKQSWEATQNLTKTAPALSIEGMQRLCSVTFKLSTRGLYYIVLTASTGELADRIDITIEQKGIAEDLLAISLTVTIVGSLIITIDQLKPFIRRKPATKND